MTTYEQVVEILVEALNVEASNIQPGTTLKNELGAESIDVLDMVFRLERTFNIKISSDEMFPRGAENFDTFTVQHIVDYVDKVKNG